MFFGNVFCSKKGQAAGLFKLFYKVPIGVFPYRNFSYLLCLWISLDVPRICHNYGNQI